MHFWFHLKKLHSIVDLIALSVDDWLASIGFNSLSDAFQKAYNEAIFPSKTVKAASLENLIMSHNTMDDIHRTHKRPHSSGSRFKNKSLMVIKKNATSPSKPQPGFPGH